MKTMQRLIFFDLKKLGTEKMNFLLPVLFFFMLATPLFFSNTDSSTNMKLSQLQTMLATRKQAADSMALDPNAQAALKKVQTGNHYLENLITAISEKDQKKELTAEW